MKSLGLHNCRLKALKGARPHNQKDADMAGDLGKPDNGAKLRSIDQRPVVDMDVVMEGLQQL